MNAWTRRPLRDVCVGVYDGPHATPPKSDHGAVFLGISNLNNGRLDLGDVEYIDEAHWERWTRRVTPQHGDVVFSYETRLGQVAMIPKGLRCCLGRRLGLLRADSSKLDARFLLYTYLSASFQEFLETRVLHGSTVDRLPIADFPDFEISVPPLRTQQGIASVLGALDDKIELNRREDRTLDTLSTALFRSWFVDFDPVQAKRDGRPPIGVPLHAVPLLPIRFEHSAIGPVPEGWVPTPLADCGVWLSGGTPSKQTARYWGGDIPWISAKSLHSFFLDHSEDRVTAAGVANGTRTVPTGSVLFLVRGMSLADEFRFGMAAREVAFNQDTKAIVPHDGIDGVLLALLLSHETDTILGLVDEASHGTKRLQTELIERVNITLPPQPVREALTEPLRVLTRKRLANRRESQTLATLRDTLLDPLLSGEISVAEAEGALAGAV